MRLCYVLLSPTFGMHQYTADLANQMVDAGANVHLVSTVHFPQDRYSPTITVHTPIATRSTGLSPSALRSVPIRQLVQEIRASHADVVHLTGPHIWNIPLLRALAQEGIPTLHTVHDLDPHLGTFYGPLLHGWNRLVFHYASHILVHGESYRERLLTLGLSPERVTHTYLLHLFLSHATLAQLNSSVASPTENGPWALFFGRLERYKGVEGLLVANALLSERSGDELRVIIAGPGTLAEPWQQLASQSVELRQRLIEDAEALDLFRRCGLVVLPYVDATQSALIAAAYFFHKPVIVTRTGALAEYVEDGKTGFLVEPDHPAGLARVLNQALAHPEQLARMGEAGHSWYRQRRATEERTLINLYSNLAGASL